MICVLMNCIGVTRALFPTATLLNVSRITVCVGYVLFLQVNNLSNLGHKTVIRLIFSFLLPEHLKGYVRNSVSVNSFNYITLVLIIKVELHLKQSKGLAASLFCCRPERIYRPVTNKASELY